MHNIMIVEDVDNMRQKMLQHILRRVHTKASARSANICIFKKFSIKGK